MVRESERGRVLETAHAAATPTAPAATAAEPGTRPYGRAGNGAVEASRQRRRTAVELIRAFESAHTKRSTRNFGLGGQHVRRRRYSGRAPQAAAANFKRNSRFSIGTSAARAAELG